MSSPDALSPFQVRRGLSGTLLPPSLEPTTSALNHEAASTLLQREAPCKCLPGPNPSTPGRPGVGGWDCGLIFQTTWVEGPGGGQFPPSSPPRLMRLWPCTHSSPSPHTVNVAPIFTDCHSSSWGLEWCLVGASSHQWTQLGGPSSKPGSWNQGDSSLDLMGGG